jgi:hypothetical protein
MTAKNKGLLRQFDDPANVAKIVYAADILCEGMPLQGPLTVRQAQAVRTALMIELLLVFPIREANLASLRVGEHIQWSQPGRRGTVSIYILPAEVKNDQDLEVQLPARTARLTTSSTRSPCWVTLAPHGCSPGKKDTCIRVRWASSSAEL